MASSASTPSPADTRRATEAPVQPDGRPAEQRDDEDQGNTRALQSTQRTEQAAPRLPHEHDQSADSQPRKAAGAEAQGEQAHDDATSGRQDTDKGAVMDKVYREQVKGG